MRSSYVSMSVSVRRLLKSFGDKHLLDYVIDVVWRLIYKQRAYMRKFAVVTLNMCYSELLKTPRVAWSF
jgi:hypothetical protein